MYNSFSIVIGSGEIRSRAIHLFIFLFYGRDSCRQNNKMRRNMIFRIYKFSFQFVPYLWVCRYKILYYNCDLYEKIVASVIFIRTLFKNIKDNDI
ncbi:hypothetical protein PUN28_006733 [Cardiocondyla obscurior]|uniref:Uncharacterized protein n=1 Tax=Cardiocondyla obscurior TaxID=286306 RepID=A0AAW2G4H4_9HYME